MNYCSSCGSDDIVFKMPPGDTRERHICQDCGEVFYTNPKIVAGCILEWQQRVLLCKRAIEPRFGLWTVPAGFMENHESVVECAIRESLEEAGAAPAGGEAGMQLHGLYNLKHVNQVYMIYRGGLYNGDASGGEETLEVKLFAEEEVPWDQVAFLVIREALERYFEDRERGEMKLHNADLNHDAGGEVRIVGRTSAVLSSAK